MASGNFAKNLKGAAGVHMVVAELSLRGLVALPTTRNLKAVDVVVFNEALSKFAFIQVKTTDKPKSGWLVHRIPKDSGEDEWQSGVKQSLSLSERFFYVFVSLPSASQEKPAYYIVPSADVADMVIKDNKDWIAGKPGRKAAGQVLGWAYRGPRPEVQQKYEGKWEILGLEG